VIPFWSAAGRSLSPRIRSGRRFSSRRPAGASVSFFLICCALALTAAAADSFTLEKIAAPPPAELPAALRDAVGSDALRVTSPSGVLCEIWLRKSVPVVATPSTELGVTFGQLAEGTLLGVMRLAGDAKDYREQNIKAGVYTLRYALHPVDGNHSGIAPQRDFALLAPVADDADPATITRVEALKRSAKSTGTAHPSVWSLWPAEDSAAAPSLHLQSDSQLWLLTFRLPLANGQPLSMSIVVVGHAPEA